MIDRFLFFIILNMFSLRRINLELRTNKEPVMLKNNNLFREIIQRFVISYFPFSSKSFDLTVKYNFPEFSFEDESFYIICGGSVLIRWPRLREKKKDEETNRD